VVSPAEQRRSSEWRYRLKIDSFQGHPNWEKSVRARKEAQVLEQIGWGQILSPHSILSEIINNEAQKV